MAAILKVWRHPAKFHPDPIWNDGTLRVSEERRSKRNKNNYNNNKMSSDTGSGVIQRCFLIA